MGKRIILAVAGAGKTYDICAAVNADKATLILAYTNANIHNINRELIQRFGTVPELTTVMTFDSYIYRHILKPYEPTILRYFEAESFVSNGITIKKPPSKRIQQGENIYNNPYYFPKSEFGHYVHNGFYYCENLAELIVCSKKGRDSVVKKAAASMNKFYEQVYIDEFQDFRKHNFELIIGLAKSINDITLVGDYYQHSVAGQNNAGKPFKNRKREVSYREFVENLKSEKFEVDTKTLIKSRRCPEQICQFVSDKLNITIEANNDNTGEIKWLTGKDINEVLENDHIVKLVDRNARDYEFNAVNWSYSKGDTIDSVCVILTGTFDEIDKDTFDATKVSQISVNKLYVALTRTRGDLYLVKKDVFDAVKKYYTKK